LRVCLRCGGAEGPPRWAALASAPQGRLVGGRGRWAFFGPRPGAGRAAAACGSGGGALRKARGTRPPSSVTHARTGSGRAPRPRRVVHLSPCPPPDRAHGAVTLAPGSHRGAHHRRLLARRSSRAGGAERTAVLGEAAARGDVLLRGARCGL